MKHAIASECSCARFFIVEFRHCEESKLRRESEHNEYY